MTDLAQQELSEQPKQTIYLTAQKGAGFKKLLKQEWTRIERKYEDPLKNAVLEAMYQLGSGESFEDTILKFQFCGNGVYLVLRKTLVQNKLLTPLSDDILNKFIQTKKKKKKNKKAKNKLSAAEIKEKNIQEKTSKNILEIIENLGNMSKETFRTKHRHIHQLRVFSSNYAEGRIIALMYCIKLFIKYKINIEECYELFIGIKKIIKNIEILDGLASIALQDLIACHDIFKIHCAFSIEEMFKKYPRLCISTKYDMIFPSMSIKPYPSQKQLMGSIKEVDQGLFWYNAQIGSGKTTISIAIAKYIIMIRALESAAGKNSKLQLLFSCSVEPVRTEVCKMAYNAKIPFGIGIMEKDHPRVINNYNCKNDVDRIIVVADINTASALLQQSQDYILFIDEPTVGADTENHPITLATVKLMFNSPAKTILSSATLPEPTEIPEIVECHKQRYPDAQIIPIYSKESLIGCEMINFNGDVLVPFKGCKTATDLNLVIEQLKTKSFIDRLLPSPLVYSLRKKMMDKGIANVVDLENYFKDVSVLKQSEIQKVAIILLETLVCEDDTLIDAICNDNYGKVTDDVTYNINNILTNHAHKFGGPGLIVVDNPFQFAENISKELFKEFTVTASQIINDYSKKIDAYQARVKKTENIKFADKNGNFDKDLKFQRMKELDGAKPTMEFPSELKVNTIDHYKEYTGKTNYKMTYSPGILEGLPLDLNIPDWTMKLLFAGVGIYSPTSEYSNQRYEELILWMASCSQLAFLISDDSICYGANYPLSHIIIDNGFAEKHSDNTIRQLAGRAGRVGTSWVATVHIGDIIMDRILDYIHNKNQSPTCMEADNMVKAYYAVAEEVQIKKENQTVVRHNGKDEILDTIEISKVKFEYDSQKNSRSNRKQSYDSTESRGRGRGQGYDSTRGRGRDSGYSNSRDRGSESTRSRGRSRGSDRGRNSYRNDSTKSNAYVPPNRRANNSVKTDTGGKKTVFNKEDFPEL